MTETVTSKHGVAIRLMAGRKWDVLEAVAQPERIVAGAASERLALKPQSDGKVLVAVQREGADDGFIITAFLTRRAVALNRRKQLWP